MNRAFRRNTKFGEINRFYTVEMQGDIVAIPAIIPAELIQAIVETIGVNNHRIRIIYGDTTTGETDWTSTFKHKNGRKDLGYGQDLEEGYVSISKRSICLRELGGKFSDVDARCMILTFRKDSQKGQFIRWENVVKVEYSNKNVGGMIWQHPFYCDDENYPSECLKRNQLLMKL